MRLFELMNSVLLCLGGFVRVPLLYMYAAGLDLPKLLDLSQRFLKFTGNAILLSLPRHSPPKRKGGKVTHILDAQIRRRGSINNTPTPSLCIYNLKSEYSIPMNPIQPSESPLKQSSSRNTSTLPLLRDREPTTAVNASLLDHLLLIRGAITA